VSHPTRPQPTEHTNSSRQQWNERELKPSRQEAESSNKTWLESRWSYRLCRVSFVAAFVFAVEGRDCNLKLRQECLILRLYKENRTLLQLKDNTHIGQIPF